ncbi:Calx-beta domain-containing protein [Litoreibacter ponti]|uniref:Calx-beta domain-containing protein n=1 Tax=Litoreibacter ponti TaxID=1510457 RepID=A0A2T6BHD7_9RHOB|nr:Calx-beta domain-containing protein [Litoreibacter ponti]PTX55456.1 Calx-beta domain-containing protein [Litoreibacter ponti]
MANLDNSDRVAIGTLTELEGTGADDILTISGAFRLAGTSTGLIDGGLGFDTLRISGSNLTATTISGIEQTEFETNGTTTIEADQIANLGTILLTGSASTSGGFLSLVGNSGDIADFSGLTLTGTQTLTVRTTSGFFSGDNLTVDFSGANVSSTAGIVFNGGGANETVTGTSGDDIINGSSGDDIIDGAGGNDTLNGGSGNNAVSGGAGDDELISSTTATGTLDGGAENDTIRVTGSFQNGTITGGSGTDSLFLISANLTGTTLSGLETTVLENNGTLTIGAEQVINLGAVSLSGFASTNGAFFSLLGASGDTADFSNLTIGDGEEVTVRSNSGFGTNDALTVDFSGTTVLGTGFVDYDGGNADETITGSTGDDQITGAGGNDVISGGSGDDALDGGSGNNTITAGSGNDTINSAATATGSIDAGADEDTITINSSFQNSTIDGGTGTDTLRLTSANLAGTTIAGVEATEFADNGFMTVDADQIANLGSLSLTGFAATNGGFLLVSGASGETADFSGLTIGDGQELDIRVSNFFGTGETLTSDFSAATVLGTGLIDYNGSNADETVIGSGAGDEITAAGGDDVISGGAGNDLLDGGSGDNSVLGGAGNDEITSFSTATGTLDGGADDDTITVNGSFQNSSIDGGTGTDTLRIGASSLVGTTIAGIEATEFTNNSFKTIDADQIANLGTTILTGNAATSGGFLLLSGSSGDTADLGAFIINDGQELNIRTSNFFGTNDLLTVDLSGTTVLGTGLIDLDGSSANETFIGSNAADEINAFGGDDIVAGGGGDDILDGGSGNNDVSGGAGNDTLNTTGSSTGTLDGGADDDTISITSNFQNSSIDGGTGTDTLRLSSASLVGTTIAGIEATEFTNNGFMTIDASQIGNLGTLTLTGSASSNGGFLLLSGNSGETADFSGLVLETGQELDIRSGNFFSTGDALTVDFSGATVNGTGLIDFNGSNADETITGTDARDEISGASGDDIINGGGGDDLLEGGAGNNEVFGNDGDDTLNATSSSGILDGGADDDTINVFFTFQNSSIVGGTGTDTLTLQSANIVGTTISGIESTQFLNNGFMTMDGAQVANLGAVTMSGNAVTNGAFLSLRNYDGLNIDLSNFTLGDNQLLDVRTSGATTDTVRIDFSGITTGNNVTLRFFGTSSTETVVASDSFDDFAGQFGDTISYETDTAGVTIDLRNDQVSGGIAQGDDITGFGNAIGGSGADIFVSDTGTNNFDGGDGSDIAVFQGNRADYTITVNGNTAEVVDNNGSTNGFDATVNTVDVETLRFADEDVVIIEPDLPQVSISGAPSLDEGDSGTTDFTFTVTRNGNITNPSTVDFAVSGGSADAADFAGGVLPSGTVSFAAGEMEQTITIQVAGDTEINEGNETFEVTLSNAVDSEIVGGGTAIGTIRDDDPLDRFFVDDPDAQQEGNTGDTTTFTFTVTRTGELSGTSTVDYNFNFGSVNADDFVGGVIPAGGTLTFAAGETEQTVSVDIAGDVIAENDEIIRMNLTNATDATIADSIGFASVLNDDSFEPTLTIADAGTQDEGDSGATTYNFVVTRTGDLSNPTTVDFDFNFGSVNAADFVGGTLPAPGTLTFGAGVSEQTISVQIAGDTEVESNEVIRVNLSNANNGQIADSVAFGFVTNDDTPPPTISIAAAADQNEGDAGTTDYTFTLTRSGDLTGTSSVDFAAVGGTVNADDFVGGVLPSGTLTFAAGESTADITVQIAGDTDVEANESIRLVISNPTDATLINTVAFGGVLNDDTPPPALSLGNATSANEGNTGTTDFVFEVTRTGDLSEASSATFAVQATGGVSADDFVGGVLPTGTVSFAAGESTADIIIQVAGDTDFEADEQIILRLSDPLGAVLSDDTGVATILNDDAAPLPTISISDAPAFDEGDTGSTDVTFTLTRGGDLSQASSVDFSVSGGVNGDDFVGGILPSGTVTFAVGESTASITVSVAGDTDIEGAESLAVVLSNPTNAVIIDDTGSTIVQNDDVPPPVLSIAPAATQDEGDAGATTFTFTVARTGSLSEASSVDFAASGGTVDAADFVGGVLPSGTLTFAPGQSEATISVDIAGDTDVEADEQISILLSNATGATILNGVGTATVANDDVVVVPPPTLSISDADTQSEGDAGATTFTFTVTRSGDLSDASSVTFGAVDGTVNADDFVGGVLPAGVLAFGEGQSEATITVSIAGDTDVEADEIIRLELLSAENATILDRAGVATVTNDDVAAKPEIVGTEGRDFLRGTDDGEIIRSLGGSYDRMIGGGGEDEFVFGAETNNGIRERDVIMDYEVGVDSIVLEAGTTIGSIRETSSQVVIFLDGDRDAIYVRGDGVTADNLTILSADAFEFV